MATSAFKSTTKRTAIGASSTDDSASSTRSSAHRRSRSLSRFSHRIATPATDDSDEVAPPRGRFVNTVRGSGFPEISLDDLAVEFFGPGSEAGSSGDGPARVGGGGESAAQRRGRSVSRYGSRLSGGGDGKGSVSSGSGGGGGKSALDNGGNLRSRRRSVSVVRYQMSDSEVIIGLFATNFC